MDELLEALATAKPTPDNVIRLSANPRWMSRRRAILVIRGNRTVAALYRVRTGVQEGPKAPVVILANERWRRQHAKTVNQSTTPSR